MSNSSLATWIGESKVVARKGRPLTLFRGISEQREDRHPSALLGVFITARKEVAEAYAGSEGVVLDVFVRIERPFEMHSNELQNLDSTDAVSRLKNRLVALGYDGIFVKPIEGSGAHPNEISEYIAFSQEQVRPRSDFLLEAAPSIKLDQRRSQKLKLL